jgi:hypothetical protein
MLHSSYITFDKPWADLNGATGFYSRFQSNPTDPPSVHDCIIDDLLGKVNPFRFERVPCMYADATPDTLHKELSIVPCLRSCFGETT